jgi:hypothetical protein
MIRQIFWHIEILALIYKRNPMGYITGFFSTSNGKITFTSPTQVFRVVAGSSHQNVTFDVNNTNVNVPEFHEKKT